MNSDLSRPRRGVSDNHVLDRSAVSASASGSSSVGTRSTPPFVRQTEIEDIVLFILMLEDDRDRISRFNAILDRHDGDAQIVIRETAREFIEAHSQLKSVPTLIGLDHDLFTDNPSDPDPGDGRDVAVYLAECEPNCPVLIHSTNAPAAESMLLTLRDAKWTADRIAPIGDDWIESSWYPVALEMITRNTQPDGKPVSASMRRRTNG